MLVCPNCGAVNEDGRMICSDCGTLLESNSGSYGKKRTGLRIPKQVLLIIAGVLAVSLLVTGVVALVSGLGNNLEKAFQRTMGEFSGVEENQTQFEQFLSMSAEQLKDGKYSMYTAFSGGMLQVEVNADYDQGKKMIRGDLNICGKELEYSVKKKVVQIRFPGEYEVYGINVDDINKLTKKINGFLDLPLVSEYVPIDLPTDLNIDFFDNPDLKEIMNGIAGDQFKAFKKSVKTERWNDETVTINGESVECKVYKISWKSEAANNLLVALGSGGMLPDVGELVNTILPEMDPYIYCYINKGYLTAVRFTVAGNKCFLLLEGEENLWDNFTLTAENISGEVRIFQGRTVRDGASMDMYLADGDNRLFSLTYNDDTGDFNLGTVEVPMLLQGQVQADKREVSIRLDWTVPELGEQSLTWRIGKLEHPPEQLGEHYTDLMTGAWSVLENFVFDLVKHIFASYA